MCKREKRRRKLNQEPVNVVGFDNTTGIGKAFMRASPVLTLHVLY